MFGVNGKDVRVEQYKMVLDQSLLAVWFLRSERQAKELLVFLRRKAEDVLTMGYRIRDYEGVDVPPFVEGEVAEWNLVDLTDAAGLHAVHSAVDRIQKACITMGATGGAQNLYQLMNLKDGCAHAIAQQPWFDPNPGIPVEEITRDKAKRIMAEVLVGAEGNIEIVTAHNGGELIEKLRQILGEDEPQQGSPIPTPGRTLH